MQQRNLNAGCQMYTDLLVLSPASWGFGGLLTSILERLLSSFEIQGQENRHCFLDNSLANFRQNMLLMITANSIVTTKICPSLGKHCPADVYLIQEAFVLFMFHWADECWFPTCWMMVEKGHHPDDLAMILNITDKKSQAEGYIRTHVVDREPVLAGEEEWEEVGGHHGIGLEK